MVQRQKIVNICDMCGREEEAGSQGASIESYSIVVNTAAADVELCAKCWAPIAKSIEKALAAGRGVRGKRKSLIAA